MAIRPSQKTISQVPCIRKYGINTIMLSLKYASLGILVVQTTAHVLTIRYSRTVDGTKYLPSTVVVLAEIIKVITSLFIWILQNGKFINIFVDSFRLMIPAALYVIQNNLLYIALTNLDAATYQITYQLKILTTAIFAVVLLGKRLNLTKWISLLLLMMGVALIQLPEESNNVETNISVRSIGILAIICACLSSGFSGVYFEKLLKNSSHSLWIRNIQLGMYGVIFGFVSVYIYDNEHVNELGFFQGYDFITWIIIFLQAIGGLVVAIVIKYADNILKSFASSISIILSTLCSYYLLNELIPSRYFLLGASLVVIATLTYSYEIPKSLQLSSISMSFKSQTKLLPV